MSLIFNHPDIMSMSGTGLHACSTCAGTNTKVPARLFVVFHQND